MDRTSRRDMHHPTKRTTSVYIPAIETETNARKQKLDAELRYRKNTVPFSAYQAHPAPVIASRSRMPFRRQFPRNAIHLLSFVMTSKVLDEMMDRWTEEFGTPSFYLKSLCTHDLTFSLFPVGMLQVCGLIHEDYSADMLL